MVSSLDNIIENVFTSTEAAQIWELDSSTVKRACQQGRFTQDECKKSSGTWLVTKDGMERLYGKPKKE